MVGVDVGLEGQVSPFNESGRDLGLHAELGNTRTRSLVLTSSTSTNVNIQNRVLH